MPTPVVMPKLGMSMEEGTVVTWPAATGQRVEKGETILVIESEKAEVEIEATRSGFFRHVYVAEGSTVPCGTLLAALTDTPDEDFDHAAFQAANQPERMISQARASGAPAPRSGAPAAGRAPAAGGAPAARTGRPAPVTPAARKSAKQLGIDPSSVPGTGPGGRVTKEDVEAWAARRETLVEVAEGVSLEVPSAGPAPGDTDMGAALLLPGFGADVSAFARQTPLLSSSRLVRGVNPRGVGLSDAPDAEIYTVEEMASDAAAVAAGPVDVVGMSLGSAVAIEMALARPEVVRSLTLITPFVRAGSRLLAVVEAWCDLAAHLSPDSLAGALLPWLFSPELLAADAARERTRRGLAAIAARVPAATLARTAAGMRAWSGTREAELGGIRVPTLVVEAGGDLLTPDAAAVAAAIPGATLVSIPNAGHAVGLEAPDEVNAAIGAHLGKLAR